MNIFIASDHAGYNLKKNLIDNLKYDLIDLGPTSSDSVDYPDYAFNLGKKVLEADSFGIIICGTGLGVSIACNKVKGIRCAKVDREKEAFFARSHNDANVIALASYTPLEEAIKYIDTFINTDFSNEERHIRRIKKITEYESKNEC